MHVSHPLIEEGLIEERGYQRTLADECLRRSTLVVLPTGMGKTVVALLVMADVLSEGRKVLLMAPTKPLVEQHGSFFGRSLPRCTVACLNGNVAPDEREALFIQSDVIVSTPQVIANDLKNERIGLRDVGLVIFDEAHRAVGSYAYVKVAAAYRDHDGIAMGMTASPGSDPEKVIEVCRNIGIRRIEVRTESDRDVAPYVHRIDVEWMEVELPGQLTSIISELKALYDRYIKELGRMGFMRGTWGPSRKHLLKVGRDIQARLADGSGSRSIYRAMSVQAMALKVGHALEMVQTQGSTALSKYLDRLEDEASSSTGSKASREVVKSEEFRRVRVMLESCNCEHPKLSRVMGVVSQQLDAHPESRVLVFTHFRDTCDLVSDRLSRIPGASVGKLVGQSSSSGERGLNQKEQVSVLGRFREGEFNVLVATSVGEEGLDVASTDLVVFYEPVASEIRTIQRRGRTGRHHTGRVVVLITKGTSDQAYHHAARNKERKMMERLKGINDLLAEEVARDSQRSLIDYR